LQNTSLLRYWPIVAGVGLLLFGMIYLQQQAKKAIGRFAGQSEPEAPLLLTGNYPLLGGGEVALGDPSQPVTLVVAYAPACGMCRTAMTEAERVAQALPTGSLRIVGLAVNEDADLSGEMTTSLSLAWPVIFTGLGWEDPLAVALDIQALPHLALIAPAGQVVANGFMVDTLEETMRQSLEPQ